jgi:hypothetical protein
MRIRKEQMAVFHRESMRLFKEETVERLRRFAPKHFEQPGEAAARRAVDVGVERAFSYGLTAQSAVRFYIEMMFILGSGFDKDPMFPWAGEILNDPTTTDQYHKTDRLYERLSDYLNRALGQSNEFYHNALRRIRAEFMATEPALGSLDLDEYLAAACRRVYPEKYAYIGDSVVRTVAINAGHEAVTCGINSDRGAIVLAALMFLLGSAVHQDPLHPWVLEALSEDNSLTRDERVERLYESGVQTLDRCLA